MSFDFVPIERASFLRALTRVLRGMGGAESAANSCSVTNQMDCGIDVVAGQS